MKKIRAFSRSPMGTTLMFMVAVLLLMTGTIGGVRATPQIFNPDFAYSGVELDQIGITLVERVGEKWNDVSWRDYDKDSESFIFDSNSPSGENHNPKMGVILQNMIPAGEKLKIGYPYPAVLAVKNSGTIPEYVRVTVYKYWVVNENGNETRFDAYDANGKDVLNKLIELNFLEDNGWVIDHSSDTKERTVLYYRYKVPGATETTETITNPFTSTLRIDNKILDYGEKVYTNENKTAWTWSWVADGLEFRIEAEADGVQDHNARAAMKSAWGLTDSQINTIYGSDFGKE